jgi:cation diffusion facilitator CzcD-associated flavoprotein CzcO
MSISDPGCGVDIPAVLYSLSYAQNPDFSNFFPKQDEVLQYMNDVVDRFDLSGHLVGNTDWIGASWQDDTKAWLVKLKDLSSGQEYVQRCSILISAVGALTNPNPFYAPGIDRFQGNIIHTARWDHSVSLRDKDVIVIGNGGKSSPVGSMERYS